MSATSPIDVVKGELFAVAAHYAGKPISGGHSDRGERRVHRCPECGTNNFRAIVFDDAQPPGSGVAGCSLEACGVPTNRDSIGVITHFEKLTGKGATPRAIKHGFTLLQIEQDPAARTAKNHGWKNSLNNHTLSSEPQTTPEEPTPSIDTRPTTPQPDNAPGNRHIRPINATETGPQIENAPTSQHPGQNDPNLSLPPKTPIEHPAAQTEEETTDDRAQTNGDFSDGHNPEAQESTAQQIPPPPGSSEGDASADVAESQDFDPSDLDLRDAVYATILGRCPRDSLLTGFLTSMNVSTHTVRTYGLAISYASDAPELLQHLAAAHGVKTLLTIPGFREQNGKIASELSTGDFVLIPYKDPQDRIIALETMSLASIRPNEMDQDSGFEPTCRLLGGGKTNRDERLGGVDHIWLPGKANRVDAMTDNLLEAMRAVSAGASVGAIRGPESAANQSRPGALKPDFEGRRVLWIPSPTDRSREAAVRNARILLEGHNARPLILSDPPGGENYEGIGTYLLSLEASQRSPAFNALFDESRSIPLPPSDQNTPPTAEPDPEDETYQPLYEAYRKRAKRAQRSPDTSRFPTPTEWAGGAVAALLLVAAAMPVLRNIVSPLLNFALAVVDDQSPVTAPANAGFGVPDSDSSEVSPEDSGRPTLQDPSGLLPWLFGRMISPISAHIEGPLTSLANAAAAVSGNAGGESTSLTMALIAVPVLVGLATVYRLRKLRFERLRMYRGTITRMRVKKFFLRLNKEEKRLSPWFPDRKTQAAKRNKKPKRSAKTTHNRTRNGQNADESEAQ